MPSTFVCSITPLDAAGELDEAGARAHFERMAAAGVGIYAGGSSPGEQYALRPDEVERLLRIAVEAAAGRVPVRAMNVEPRSARQMCEMVRVAERCGVDALQIYSLDVGHGGRPGDAELERYFRSVLDAASLPCVLSSHFLGGYVLSLPLLERLLAANGERVAGLNVSTNDLAYLSRLLEALAGRVEVHVGGPLHALSALAMGASGFLSAEANIAPRLAARLIEAWAAGRHGDAAGDYARLMRLYTTRPDDAGATARWIKAALDHLGLPGGPVREPALPLPPPEVARIAARLDRLGLDALL